MAFSIRLLSGNNLIRPEGGFLQLLMPMKPMFTNYWKSFGKPL